MAFSDDLKKPAFPFIEVAYVALFFHAIGWNYFFDGLGFIGIPQHRLRDFLQEADRTIVWWAWASGFGLFLFASSYQLLRVYLRVILSDDLDKKHCVFGSACARFKLQSTVLFLHYSLRLGAILLLLFIEKSLYERTGSTVFFQRWSLVLGVFYGLLVAYSICVSTFKARWSWSILREMNLGVGYPSQTSTSSDPKVVTQAREAFWQSVGWSVTDFVLLIAYLIMFWISIPEGGQSMSSLVVVLVLFGCAVLSTVVFVLEWYWPLIEDVKTMLSEYSWVKTGPAFVLAFLLWLGAEKLIGSLLT